MPLPVEMLKNLTQRYKKRVTIPEKKLENMRRVAEEARREGERIRKQKE